MAYYDDEYQEYDDAFLPTPAMPQEPAYGAVSLAPPPAYEPTQAEEYARNPGPWTNSLPTRPWQQPLSQMVPRGEPTPDEMDQQRADAAARTTQFQREAEARAVQAQRQRDEIMRMEALAAQQEGLAPHEQETLRLQSQLGQAQLSFAERQQLQKIQNGIARVRQDMQSGTLKPEWGEPLLAELHGQAAPLERRASMVPILTNRAKWLQLQQDSAQQEAIMAEAMGQRAQALSESQVANVVNPSTGEVQQLVPQGWQPLAPSKKPTDAEPPPVFERRPTHSGYVMMRNGEPYYWEGVNNQGPYFTPSPQYEEDARKDMLRQRHEEIMSQPDRFMSQPVQPVRPGQSRQPEQFMGKFNKNAVLRWSPGDSEVPPRGYSQLAEEAEDRAEALRRFTSELTPEEEKARRAALLHTPVNMIPTPISRSGLQGGPGTYQDLARDPTWNRLRELSRERIVRDVSQMMPLFNSRGQSMYTPREQFSAMLQQATLIAANERQAEIDPVRHMHVVHDAMQSVDNQIAAYLRARTNEHREHSRPDWLPPPPANETPAQRDARIATARRLEIPRRIQETYSHMPPGMGGAALNQGGDQQGQLRQQGPGEAVQAAPQGNQVRLTQSQQALAQVLAQVANPPRQAPAPAPVRRVAPVSSGPTAEEMRRRSVYMPR